EQADQVAAELQSDPSVEWAEPDVFVFPSSVPSDPEYESSQWNLWDEWGIGLPRTASDATAIDPQAGAGVTVAVIDTGITSHPDLDSQLVPGYDFVSDPANLTAPRVEGGPDVGFDADGQPGRDADPTDPGDWRGVTPTRDSTWHGTQVAGVIAAQAGNSEGIVGVAPGAKIQPIRALSWRGGLMSDIISSITWASGGNVDGAPANANPADVITMSFAAQAQCSVALQTAIDDANERGSVLVAAAGNANDDVANYTPANCLDVIAVAATGRDGKRAPYSNYGPGIDIAAPGGSLNGGGGVLSTSNSGAQFAESANYRSGEGTSIAAAHVAGAIARVKSDEPEINPDQLRTRFLSSEQVQAFPDQQCDPDPNINCGSGLLTLAEVSSTPSNGITVIAGAPNHVIEVDCDAVIGYHRYYVPWTITSSTTFDTLEVRGLSTCNSKSWSRYNRAIQPSSTCSFGPLYSFCGAGIYDLNQGVLDSGKLIRNTRAQLFQTTDGVLEIIFYFALDRQYPPGVWTPQTQTINGTKGVSVTPSLAYSIDGPTTPTFSISPLLPAGMSIDPTTGVISGTPTVTHPTTVHTVTATMGGDAPTATVTVSVALNRVSFNAGGGSVSPGFADTTAPGDSVTLPTPTRANHLFNGWYTAASGVTRVGGGGDTYIPSASVTLYAQWTPPYVVGVNRQGGSGSTASLNVIPGDHLTLPTQNNQSALTFAGWFDAASGGTRLGGSGDSILPGGGMTIYAQWTATASFRGNGGSLPGGMSSIAVNINTTPQITLPTPTRSGYRFLGWWSSTGGGTKYGDGGDSYSMTRNLTLQARWLSLSRVDFDPNGGSLSDQRCEASGSFCRIWWGSGDPALVLPTPASASGLIFDGWYTSSSGGTRRGGGGATLSNPGTETLRAQWTGTITFDPNGGSVAAPSVSGKKGTYVSHAVPYRPGYAFGAWRRSTGQDRLRNSNNVRVDRSENWTARWEQYPDAPAMVGASLSDDRRTIRLMFDGHVQALYGDAALCEDFAWSSSDSAFDAGVGRTCEVDPADPTVVLLQPTGPTGAPLRDAVADLTVAYVGRSLAAGSDQTKFVHQTADIAAAGVGFDVSYLGNGGNPGRSRDRVGPRTPLTLPAATRSNLTFAGWYDQSAGGARLARAGDAFIATSDTELHAQWEARVTFDSEGSVVLPNPTDVNINSDPPLQLPGARRVGFTFQGWFTEPSGGTLVGAEGDTFLPSENARLHARWRAIPVAPPGGGGPPRSDAPRVPPRLNVGPPRIETDLPVSPGPRRPAVVVVDGEPIELFVERDEENTELDITGEAFSLAVATADTEKRRIAPTAQRSLVAPVRGFVDVQANGYASQSTVSLYLVPRITPRMSVRNATDVYFLGEVAVNEDQTFAEDFPLPEWAQAGEYTLQINGYTPAGAMKSINVRLDLIDRRADAVSVARACVFPEDSVKLTTECRQSLRSLKQVLPDSVDALTIDITG
ncbi:MAG TPA: InlB B-repeat-containing protein, partial [Acidimicrobiia bacterium]